MTDFKCKPVLGLDHAKAIIKRATEKAVELNVCGAFAVVDDSGNLVCLEKLDGTMPAASNIAIGKAATCAAFRRPTKLLEELIQSKRIAMLDLSGITNTPYVPLMGAYPIYINDQIVGAVSVAGAETGENDETIALYATDLFPNNIPDKPLKQ